MTHTDPQHLIRALGLALHPEGGHYREVHRSDVGVGAPAGYSGERIALTAIYFLLQRGEFSAFHRVRGEEVWVHLAGDPLELVLLGEEVEVLSLAPVGRPGRPLQVVPPGIWQAARTRGAWTLATCLVAPGFEFADFELPGRAALLKEYPGHATWVLRFTH